MRNARKQSRADQARNSSRKRRAIAGEDKVLGISIAKQKKADH
jgi:hypothetical protein